jgi:hypothetical protein
MSGRYRNKRILFPSAEANLWHIVDLNVTQLQCASKEKDLGKFNFYLNKIESDFNKLLSSHIAKFIQKSFKL